MDGGLGVFITTGYYVQGLRDFENSSVFPRRAYAQCLT
jgi:hypothetical protein